MLETTIGAQEEADGGGGGALYEAEAEGGGGGALLTAEADLRGAALRETGAIGAQYEAEEEEGMDNLAGEAIDDIFPDFFFIFLSLLPLELELLDLANSIGAPPAGEAYEWEARGIGAGGGGAW
jgi:hypothetical protein